MSEAGMAPAAEADVIQRKLKGLPARPGVYLMKNDKGEVIYVGKAVSLRNRVRSYFQESQDAGPKVRAMVSHIADFDYIVTDSEVEALILECNLIKEKEPWYNIRLKDDKSYPYLKVSAEPFPRVIVVRRPTTDDRVFGPYTDARAVRETLNVLRKLFSLRTCKLDLSKSRQHRPCLLYHIGRCAAPCANLQTEAEYDEIISQVILFLQGRHDDILPVWRRQMQEAAERLEFERAAALRDQVQALEKVIERQKIVSGDHYDQDVLGLAMAGPLACVQVFFVRSGKVVGSERFFLDISEEDDEQGIITAFVEQYYAQARMIPQAILLPTELELAEVIAQWLQSKRGSRVRLLVPKRGEKRQLVAMVAENARLMLAEKVDRENIRQQHNEAGLAQLQEVLGLPGIPHVIEAFDVSNFQGGEVVASQVVLVDGEPDTDAYRRFRIRGFEGQDDFAAINEAVRRRFTRALHEQEQLAALPLDEQEAASAKAHFARLPDLVLIDGGKGQLSAARLALVELGLEHLPIIGLTEKEEEIILANQDTPLRLAHNAAGLHLLQRIRDEAHRFAITYHRQLRDRKTVASALDTIEGVGPKRKRALIKHFGSVRGVKQATLAQLQEVPGLPEEVAKRVFEQLGGAKAASNKASPIIKDV